MLQHLKDSRNLLRAKYHQYHSRAATSFSMGFRTSSPLILSSRATHVAVKAPFLCKRWKCGPRAKLLSYGAFESFTDHKLQLPVRWLHFQSNRPMLMAHKICQSNRPILMAAVQFLEQRKIWVRNDMTYIFFNPLYSPVQTQKKLIGPQINGLDWRALKQQILQSDWSVDMWLWCSRIRMHSLISKWRKRDELYDPCQ